MRESRANARGLLDATQESLLLVNREGVIMAANHTAAHRLKTSLEALIGENLFNLIPQEIIESRKSHFNSVLQTGTPVDFEDTREGIVFHNSYFPVQTKTGEFTGVAIFAQDITKRKRAEEELKRNVAEMERFNKMAIGRELKMIQLKEEINELLENLNQDKRYKIVT